MEEFIYFISGTIIGFVIVGIVAYIESYNNKKDKYMEQVMENQVIDLAKELKQELHKREVKFSYWKKDGSIREAKGTLNSEIYGKDNEPTGTGRPVPENQVRYYDLDAQGWRSLLSENLIGWE